MIIPCIKDKCITYPMCQNKRDIKCPDIYNYYNKMRIQFTRDEVWKLIKKHLKEMRTFKCCNDEEPEEDPEGN